MDLKSIDWFVRIAEVRPGFQIVVGIAARGAESQHVLGFEDRTALLTVQNVIPRLAAFKLPHESGLVGKHQDLRFAGRRGTIFLGRSGMVQEEKSQESD